MAALTCRASWNAWRFSSRAGRRRPFLSANMPRLMSPRTPSYRCRRRPGAVPAHRPQLWRNARTGFAARATHHAHHAGWSARIPEDHPTYGGGRQARRKTSVDRASPRWTKCWAAVFQPGIPCSSLARLARAKAPLPRRFIAAGLAAGEPAAIAVFEEHPKEVPGACQEPGPALDALAPNGLFGVVYLRPLELSVAQSL